MKKFIEFIREYLYFYIFIVMSIVFVSYSFYLLYCYNNLTNATIEDEYLILLKFVLSFSSYGYISGWMLKIKFKDLIEAEKNS